MPPLDGPMTLKAATSASAKMRHEAPVVALSEHSARQLRKPSSLPEPHVDQRVPQPRQGESRYVVNSCQSVDYRCG
jgi:hypothetical protein